MKKISFLFLISLFLFVGCNINESFENQDEFESTSDLELEMSNDYHTYVSGLINIFQSEPITLFFDDKLFKTLNSNSKRDFDNDEISSMMIEGFAQIKKRLKNNELEALNRIESGIYSDLEQNTNIGNILDGYAIERGIICNATACSNSANAYAICIANATPPFTAHCNIFLVGMKVHCCPSNQQ